MWILAPGKPRNPVQIPHRNTYPGAMSKIWSPSEKWRRRHKQSRVYRVRLQAHIDDAKWADLDNEYADEQGVLGLGGVTLTRLAPDQVDAISGGEDAFDSLDYAINEVLANAASKVEVVDEEELKNW